MLQDRLEDGVLTLTLNRPGQLNALSWELADCLRAAITAAGEDLAVRAVVITGAGRAFSAGADLRDLSTVPPGQLPGHVADNMAGSVTPLVTAMLTCPVPVVAAVNGLCVGGVVGLALLADLTLAARGAYFALPQVPALHLIPDVGATWALAHRAGRARALGMALTGERVPAERAEEWGLIWRCVEDDDLAACAHAAAQRLSVNPAAAVAAHALADSAIASIAVDQVGRENEWQRRLAGYPAVTAAIERFATGSRAATKAP